METRVFLVPGKKRNHYDDEFKRNAVMLLIDSGKPVKVIAYQLGVEQSVLYKWHKQFEAEIRFRRLPQTKGDYSEEISELRRELYSVRTTVESLRKIILKTLGDRYLDISDTKINYDA